MNINMWKLLVIILKIVFEIAGFLQKKIDYYNVKSKDKFCFCHFVHVFFVWVFWLVREIIIVVYSVIKSKVSC